MIAKRQFTLGKEFFAKGADLSRLSEEDQARVRVLGLVVTESVKAKMGVVPLAAAFRDERAPEDDSGLGLPNVKAPQEMTVAELRAELNALEVSYLARANRAELLRLYIEAMQKIEEDEDPAEGGGEE